MTCSALRLRWVHWNRITALQPRLDELQQRPNPRGDRVPVAIGTPQLQRRRAQIQLHVLQPAPRVRALRYRSGNVPNSHQCRTRQAFDQAKRTPG